MHAIIPSRKWGGAIFFFDHLKISALNVSGFFCGAAAAAALSSPLLSSPPFCFAMWYYLPSFIRSPSFLTLKTLKRYRQESDNIPSTEKNTNKTRKLFNS